MGHPDILLIQPPLSQQNTEFFTHDRGNPNHGLASIVASQRRVGRSMALIDAQAQQWSAERVVREVRALHPSLVGISALTYQILSAGELATKLKRAFPRVPIVLGGRHGSVLPERTLAEFPSLDAVVQGDGEYAIGSAFEAFQGGSPRPFPGFWLRDADLTVAATGMPQVEDLDALPPPDFDLFPLRSYWPLYSRRWMLELPISFSRGCSFSCVFCTPTHDGRVRWRAPGAVVDEMERGIVDLGCRQFVFSDENLTQAPQRLHRLCELILRRGLARRARLVCQSRAQVAPQTLQLMARAGFSHIAFGLESGDPEILARIGKELSLEQGRRTIAATKAAGIVADANFILGLPYETEATIRNTIDFACSLPLDYAKFFLLVPYPGTEVHDLARRGEANLRLVSDRWEDYGRNLDNALELTTVPRARMARLQLEGYLRFYSAPRRWPHFLREYPLVKSVEFLVRRLASSR